MKDQLAIKQITIFGVGLIGGSLALSLKKAGFCQHIVGCSRQEENLQQAQDLGVIDSYSTDAVKAIEGSDLIFLSVPLGAMQAIFAQIKPVLGDKVIITDGGSSKQSVVDAMQQAMGYLPDYFVPGHPIAGREKSGVEAAIDDLYQDRKVILTPLDNTNAEAMATVTAMWQATGAYVENLPVDIHDRVLAATSHLPHILAYQLVDTLNHCAFSEDVFRYAAGGFQDFTRIASSDPTMWRDVCLSNREAVLELLSSYQQDLDKLKALVDTGEGDAIFDLFSGAKSARDSYLQRRILEIEQANHHY